MSAEDDILPEDSDDLLAAEYVLGALPAEQRAGVARRIETDAVFARLVDEWEVHLSPLASAYAEAAPPARVRQEVDRRLFGTPAASEPLGASWRPWSSLAVWRTLAVAGFAAFAAAIVVPALLPPPVQQDVHYVASLAADGSPVRYVAMYDAATGELALSHLAGEREQGRDFELWMIEGGGAPVSMGVIPPGEAMRMPVAAAGGKRPGAGMTLAVSLEPVGGSPTGQPTGPVVAAGELRAI